jgi:hypothetical protein
VLTFFAVGLICDGAGRRCGNFARTLLGGRKADDKSLAGYLRWVAGTSTIEEEVRMSTGTKRALEVPSDTTHTTADGRTVVDVRRLLNKEHVKETFRRIQDKIVIVRRPRRSLDSASES